MLVNSILQTKGTSVVTASLDDSLSKVMEILSRHGIGAVVITDAANSILGILSERDAIHAISELGAEALQRTAGSLMSTEVVTCRHGDHAADLMAIMTERRIRHLPVVENGRLCGILSIGDVVKSRVDEIEHEAEALKDYVKG